MKLWMHVFPTATHPPVLPRIPFQAPPLCVLVLFFCNFPNCSFLPAFLPSVSAVDSRVLRVCTQKGEEKNKIFQNPTNVEKFLTEFSAPLPDGRLEMKSCWNGDEISFAYLFIYCTEVLVNKCVSFEGKTFNERGFQWVQPHPEPNKKSPEPCFFIVFP